MFFFFNEPTTTVIYTLSLHDALPIYVVAPLGKGEVGGDGRLGRDVCDEGGIGCEHAPRDGQRPGDVAQPLVILRDRKSTRLNSSHVEISYAVFCLKKKKLTIM